MTNNEKGKYKRIKNQRGTWWIVLLTQFTTCFAIIVALFFCGVINITCDNKSTTHKLFSEQHKFRVCKEDGYLMINDFHDHIQETTYVKLQNSFDAILRRKVSNRLTKFLKSKLNIDKDLFRYGFGQLNGCIKIYDAFFDMSKIDKYIKKTKKDNKDSSVFKWFNNNIRENDVAISNSYRIDAKYFLRLTEDKQNIYFVMKGDYDALKSESRADLEKDLKEAQESKTSNAKERIKYFKEALESFDEDWKKYVDFSKKVLAVKISFEEVKNILAAVVKSKKAKNAGIDTVCVVKIGDGISICFLNSKLLREHYDDNGKLISKSTIMEEFKKFNFDIVWQTSAAE